MKVLAKNIFLMILAILVFSSCAQNKEDCVEEREENGETVCITAFVDDVEISSQNLRWMDRKIYLASPGGNPLENTELQKQKLKEYIQEFEYESGLGIDYFSFEDFDQTLLDPNFFDENRIEGDVKSFILFWDDTKFDQFKLNRFNNIIPDNNAMTVTHNQYKRKFYIILRASCFTAGGVCQLNTNGAKALVARQLSFLVDIPEVACQEIPQNIMCTKNSDQSDQWNESNLMNHIAVFNNRLNVIRLNPNYYGDLKNLPQYSKLWMSQKVYLSESVTTDEGVTYNTEIQKQKIITALNEIACDTSLGCSYFNFEETAEENLPLLIEDTLSDNRFASFIRILPDVTFSELWQQVGGDADVNAILIINSAFKRQFQLIIRNSCFETNDNCNNISSEEGLKALLARQIGRMAGLSIVSCDTFPESVMCGDFPQNPQWELSNKNRWIHQFNNNLETILNIPSFYTEFIPNE